MMAKSISTFIDRYRVSVLGLSLGLLFFAASLTPSLIPRPALMQGALGGFLMALGYLTGADPDRNLAVSREFRKQREAGRVCVLPADESWAVSRCLTTGPGRVSSRPERRSRTDEHGAARGKPYCHCARDSYWPLFPAFLPRASPGDNNAVDQMPDAGTATATGRDCPEPCAWWRSSAGTSPTASSLAAP